MTVRAKLLNGALVPLDPLPESWRDGRELSIADNGTDQTDAPTITELVDDDADWLDDEEYERLKAALEQIRQEQKELSRREMERG